MFFYKIQDPNKRDEIVKEINDRRKRIYQNSINDKISDTNFQADVSKLFKPIIESNEKMIKSLSVDQKKKRPFEVNKVGDKMYIGKMEVEIDGDDIIVGGERYEGTKGLWELMTELTIPKSYTDEDLQNYEKILMDSDAIRSDSQPHKPKSSRRPKYQQLIAPIWEKMMRIEKGKKGSGVIILPSDPNALVEKLELSIAAWHAGNKESRNVAVAICDELLRQGEINKEEYKSLMRTIDKII